MLRQTHPFFEIIVVEATSGRSILAEHLEQLYHPCTSLIYIAADHPGASRQRNLGIAQAKGDIVFFTDDDTILEKDCVEHLIQAYLEKGEQAWGVQPVILQDIHVHFFSRIVRKVFLLSDVSSKRPPYMKLSGFPCLAGRLIQPLPAEVLCGVVSYRRSILNHYQFDERLGQYSSMEDIDLSYRISRDFPLWVFPKALVHHDPAQVGRVSRQRYYEIFSRNYWYLFKKNIPKTSLHLLAFAWANIGLLLLFSINSLRWRTIAPLRGALIGYREAVRGIFLQSS